MSGVVSVALVAALLVFWGLPALLCLSVTKIDPLNLKKRVRVRVHHQHENRDN